MMIFKHGITNDGKLVKIFSNGDVKEIEENNLVILCKDRDRFSPGILHYFLGLCEDNGANSYHLQRIKEMMERFEDWVSHNITKQPGITHGIKWDGVSS